MITRNCHGYLPSQVAFYLQNVHIQPRKIYLSLIAENQEHLHGSGPNRHLIRSHCLYLTLSIERLAGTESGKLTESGVRFAHELVQFIKQEQRNSLVEAGREVFPQFLLACSL